jgi:hypothetical protein
MKDDAPMLQGHADTQADKLAFRGRVGLALLVLNVAAIVLVAAWRHAAADEPNQGSPNASSQTGGPEVTLPTIDSPAAASPGVPSGTPTALDAAAPLTEPPAQGSAMNDPVLQELRKLIQDPNGGLDIPRLDATSPLAHLTPDEPQPAEPQPTESEPAESQPASRVHISTQRLRQRMESIHSLSTAAVALLDEAQELGEAGSPDEAARLIEHVRHVRAMIAALAADADPQP